MEVFFCRLVHHSIVTYDVYVCSMTSCGFRGSGDLFNPLEMQSGSGVQIPAPWRPWRGETVGNSKGVLILRHLHDPLSHKWTQKPNKMLEVPSGMGMFLYHSIIMEVGQDKGSRKRIVWLEPALIPFMYVGFRVFAHLRKSNATQQKAEDFYLKNP